MPNTVLTLMGIALFILLSAFFSGMEIAYLSSDRLTMEIKKDRKTANAAILRILFANPDLCITTLLVGNNIVLVVYGLLMSAFIDPLLSKLSLADGLIIVLDSFIATFFIIIFGEYRPKSYFKRKANQVMQRFSFAMFFFYVILYPISVFCVLLTKIISWFTGRGNNTGLAPKLTVVDLEHYLSNNFDNEGNGGELNTEVKIMQKAIDFSEVKARDCMVPRNELVACDLNTPLEQLKSMFVLSGLSKIIVYNQGIDEVVGYIHAQEVFRGEGWQKRIKKALYVPESIFGHKLMKLLMQSKRSMAIVIDEMGGTAGIVTLEDLVEEIFGEIEDEHDKATIVIKQTAENVYILSGRAEIDEVNETCNLSIPDEDEYNTIAGFIISEHRSIPKRGETVTIGNYVFEILRSSSTRIELVKLSITEY